MKTILECVALFLLIFSISAGVHLKTEGESITGGGIFGQLPLLGHVAPESAGTGAAVLLAYLAKRPGDRKQETS